MPPRLEIIAHRGAPRAYTENTLPSFRCALEGGADAIELDVHATADGVVVVHHDPTLSLAHLGRREPVPAIASLTFAELEAAASAGHDRVPRLKEALELAGPRVTVYVEVKAPRIEREVVDVIRASSTPCAVHSFDHRVALRVRELAREIPTGILLSSYLIDPVGALRGAGARDLWQQWELIDEELVSRVHDAGARVIAWTVNASEVAESLAALGVDGICSDVSTDFVRELARRA
jgi:glycerophosphoryl diester phosphodiesterase